jgi:hypothetical protein
VLSSVNDSMASACTVCGPACGPACADHLCADQCADHLCCDNPLYHFKGARSAPGRGRPPFMQERHAIDPLTVGRRSVGPQVADRQGDCDAPGDGCLPLAPSGHVGAVTQLNSSGRPPGQRAATSAVVRGLQEGPSLRRPHSEALQDQAQGRTCGASLRADPCA